MGMFDWINFKTACPTCATPVSGFQSKDAGCEMVTLEPEDVDNFYSSCDKCGTWVEFSREPERRVPRPDSLTEEQVLALGFEKSFRSKKEGVRNGG